MSRSQKCDISGTKISKNYQTLYIQKHFTPEYIVFYLSKTTNTYYEIVIALLLQEIDEILEFPSVTYVTILWIRVFLML